MFPIEVLDSPTLCDTQSHHCVISVAWIDVVASIIVALDPLRAASERRNPFELEQNE